MKYTFTHWFAIYMVITSLIRTYVHYRDLRPCVIDAYPCVGVLKSWTPPYAPEFSAQVITLVQFAEENDIPVFRWGDAATPGSQTKVDAIIESIHSATNKRTCKYSGKLLTECRCGECTRAGMNCSVSGIDR